MNDSVFIVGATRGTGFETARLLTAADKPVIALVRVGSDRAALEALGVEIIEGDVLDAEFVATQICGAPVTAIISCLGGKRGEPRPDFDG